ncbi:hypothetical protein C8R43DRAFT_1241174 [Mycena crocata]|nr:hypothetical protein C8R43DRAFT_1241174 [Mycena crocata]
MFAGKLNFFVPFFHQKKPEDTYGAAKEFDPYAVEEQISSPPKLHNSHLHNSRRLFVLVLFSYAIRRSVVIYLHRPMSLAALGASVSISMRSVVFHRRDWKWPAVSLFFFFMTGVQTSGWSTLITPVPIVISTPLYGGEIDLASPLLQKMQDTNSLSSCVMDNAYVDYVLAGESEGGIASAKGFFGYASALTSFLDEPFNVSTGGILPVSFDTFNSSTLFPTSGATYIPATLNATLPAQHVGLATNYSMVQQVDVSCSLQNLTNATKPNLSVETNHALTWELDDSPNITQYTFFTDCEWTDPANTTPLNWTNAFAGEHDNYVAMVGCNDASTYTLVILTNGLYAPLRNTVCKMNPKVTKVNVDYGAVINIEPQSSEIPQDVTGAAGTSAMRGIYNLINGAQAVERNAVGNQWMSVKSQPGWSDHQTLRMIERYLKGATEYGASALRACLSSKNATFLDGVPSNMTIETHGVFRTETMGWAYVSQTTRWVLIPGTFIAFVTIVVVLVAVYRHAGHLPRESDPFDPSNPLHLMAAASGGGLMEAFGGGLDSKAMKQQEKVDVVLTAYSGRGPTLVRADQYTPVFTDAFSPRSAYTP